MEYHVSGKKFVVVDIPVGYAHNLENTGKTDLVALLWASEWTDPAHPDDVDSILPIY
jgi:UDP-2-acetamido-2,6-beta-L-arabino-hexul-4-ose reductase